MRRVYFDYAAGAPLKPEVREAMDRWLQVGKGNPSSLHQEGQESKREIDKSREIISSKLGCLFGELIFTSGGTESANQAIFGITQANKNFARKKVLMSAIEHHCVLSTKRQLEADGYEVCLVKVTPNGVLDLDDFKSKLDANTLLVCCMHCNNEIGTFQPVLEVIQASHDIGAYVFMDAVQTFGLLDETGSAWTVKSIPADLISISAHKIGGPPGVGGLYIRSGLDVNPIIHGGGQEREMRAGTESVINIVGFGVAASVIDDGTDRGNLRDAFERLVECSGLNATLPLEIARHPGISHFICPYPFAESALIRLDQEGVAAASGAACASGSIEPSHVLLACGFDDTVARAGLRFSFGSGLSAEDIEYGANVVNHVNGELIDIHTRQNSGPISHENLPHLTPYGIGIDI